MARSGRMSEESKHVTAPASAAPFCPGRPALPYQPVRPAICLHSEACSLRRSSPSNFDSVL